ncbi:TIGR02391 family protein [Actinophytocola sp. NPDC049390]|uniref:TIGR02391 family protein n=1 Tax=Actinophytocola sp. NPDC049390 TaxID=3363894 RepID=UPI003796B2CF
MNREWMRQQLESYLELVDRMRRAQTPPVPDTRGAYGVSQDRAQRLALSSELRRKDAMVKQIIKRLDPALADFNVDRATTGLGSAQRAVERALGILEHQEEWEENLAPDGPTLPANQFHPWVWDAARTLWESKHFRMAVNAAATAINAHTQTKVGDRSISDNDLMNRVFRNNPQPGQKVLKLPGDHQDLTIQSRQRSLRPFAEGCFAGIRNPAAHDAGPDWNEQEALEYLAALSILARAIDECEVVVHS